MTRSKNKFMIGVNDLIAEIKDNSSIIFANSTSVFFLALAEKMMIIFAY